MNKQQKWDWRDVKIVMAGKEVTGITEVTYPATDEENERINAEINDTFVAFDDHLRL